MSKKIVSILAILVLVQAAYSFLAPTYGTNNCWKNLETLSAYKGHSFDSFDQKIVGRIYSLISNYHLVCDAGGFVVLAHDFPQDYFRGRLLFINRPLYPLMVNLMSSPLHLISDSFSMTFVAAILCNLILLLATALLFFSLVKKFFSVRVAFLSSILLILSPFAHSWLIQTETSMFGAFLVILSLWLLHNYATAPSFKKLIGYSLIIGLLMVGKMVLAVSLFVLLLAFYYRKIKEGLIFLIAHSIPFLCWYLWTTQIWHLNFAMQEVTNFGVGVWIFEMLKWPIGQIMGELIQVVPNFFTAIIYGFLLIPVVFSAVGLKSWLFNKKYVIYFGMLAAFLIFFFAMRLYLPRHAFLLFPIIYPTAVLGIDKVVEWFKNKNLCRPALSYALFYLLIILSAGLDIFRLYGSLGVPYS